MREKSEVLALYAMPIEESRGRRYAEAHHSYRNDYERDRDRIIHSRAFRRLENKTQVFTRRYSDHFRTRLTHTLEVAQISRTAARALGLQQDLVEALALAHDIGHPPFGHAGEDALDHVVMRYGGRFEHNLHALRIVERIEQKYAAFPGLNLTFEVREGIIKHSRGYDAGRYPELGEYALDQQPPVEAQLIDLADEIAYNCADLDDGYEAGLLGLAQIRAEVPLFDTLYRSAERQHPHAQEKLLFNEGLRKLVDALVTSLIDATRERLRKAGARSVEQVRRLPARVATLSPAIREENQKLKNFLGGRLYAHPSVGAEHKPIAHRLEQLFDYYMRHPRSLGPRPRHGDPEPSWRAVCDYIAGMTDNFFEEQYRKYICPSA